MSSHESVSLVTDKSSSNPIAPAPAHHSHHSSRIHDTVIELDDGPRVVEIAGMTAPSDMAGPGVFTAPENMVADDEKKDFERTESLKDVQHLPRISDSDLPPYLRFLTKLRDAWKDCPDVHLQFSDLAYNVQIPVRDTGIRNFLQTGLDGLKRLDVLGKINKAWGPKKKQFTVLAPMSGRIAPGSMTLVLTPPGHGKSTFLKALAGRLDGDQHVTGQVLFNGLTRKEAKAKGVHVHRMVSYIGQTDIHFPVLTVRETLEFAAKNAVPDITSLTSDPELIKMDSERANMLMGMLGLSECADTIIGNDLLRGVSGGQRRRSTLGEMLITNARVIMMDEVSTGLDAAVTYHIFHALQKWAHLCRGSIVTALLQPTPEVYNLFDDIILLREGELIYHGPRAGVRSFFAEHLHLPIPEDADEGGFVVDYLNDPKSVIHRMKKRAIKQQMAAAGMVVPPSPQIGLMSGAGGSIHLNEVSPLVLDRKRPDPSLLTAPADLTMELPRLSSSLPPSVKEEKEPEVYNAEEPLELLAIPRDGAFHPSQVPTTTSAMLSAYRASTTFAESQNELKSSLAVCSSNDPKTSFDPSRWSEYTQLQFARPFPHSFWHFTKLDMVRQAKLTFRNKAILVPRMIQAVVMGLIFSTLFFQLGADDYASKFGLLLYCVMFGAFSNLSELPIAAEARNVVTKQLDAGFFPPMPFIISNVVWTVPKVVAESILFGTLMYWITGFTADGGRFLYFLFILSLSSLSLSAFFRTISFMTSNPDVARQMDFPFILLFVIFGGFLISSDKIPNWLIWIYWLNPLNWSVTSLAQNEFLSPAYSDLVAGGSITRGVKYLNAFSIRTDSVYRFTGIAYLLGFFAFSAILSAAAIAYVRGTTTLGTKRTTDLSAKEKKEADGHAHPEQKVVVDLAHNQSNDTKGKASNGEVAIQMSAMPSAVPNQLAESSLAALSSTMSGAASASRLPFVPVTLAWKNIRYTVTVGSGKTQKQLVLLKGISGFSKPGTMTALMGSSGAGKTTLMDVIAGRKTTGVIEGDILINGNKVGPSTFNKITGYVEQQDLHMGMTTVREALIFSAKLRLPATVDHATREAWVDEVMALVGLSKISGRLVGDAALPGLSPGQLKLLTIGVELVANPSVLFLDEPTSGLDAPSAFRVMSAVKRITQTGRSVLCTIHQPSAELFFMFDRLLLLRSGGEDVYFANVGENGRDLVQYFESVSEGKAPKCPEEQNPANWMLDVIGAGVASAEGGNIQTSGFQYADYVSIWRSSSLHAQTAKDTKDACESSPKFDELISRVDRETYVNEWTRYWEVQKRFFIMHWRNPPTNLTRLVLCLIIGIMLGLIYLQIGTADFQAVQSLLSAIFMGIAFPASVSAASAFPSFFRQRAVYYRESTIGMYQFYSFNAAMAIVELPYIWFGLLFFVIPFYFMIGLASDGSLFFQFYLVLFLMAVCYSSLSQLWMALAPSPIASNVLNGFFMSMFFMFGGVFIRPDAMPRGWKWFYYLDPIPKALIAATAPQFYCDTSVPGCPQIEVTTASGTEVQYVSDYIADSVSGTSSQYGEYIGYLILTILVIRLLNLLCLKKISHLKR